MKERPILFSAPMVQALLAGMKTQTRRIVKFKAGVPHTIFPLLDPGNNPTGEWFFSDAVYERVGRSRNFCPYGKPGDRMWVRETFASTEFDRPSKGEELVYRADGYFYGVGFKWTPSIFMPRWASRITLEITGVRVQRLQEISEEDAIAEGCTDGGCNNCGTSSWPNSCGCASPEPLYVDAYTHLWESINGAGSWNLNPWVWVITFAATSSPVVVKTGGIDGI